MKYMTAADIQAHKNFYVESLKEFKDERAQKYLRARLFILMNDPEKYEEMIMTEDDLVETYPKITLN